MRLATLLPPGRGETPAVISPDGTRYRPLDGSGPLAERLAAPLRRPEVDWDEAPDLSGIRFAPLIPRPGALWCVGLNYEDHRLETGRAKADYPTLFTRFPASLIGHGEALVLPSVSHQLDYEAEFAVVIGRTARHVAEESALDYVARLLLLQRRLGARLPGTQQPVRPRQELLADGRVRPFPWSPPDEVPDPQDLPIGTRLNGEVVQASHTSQMTYPVRELIAYLSRIHPLHPGDVIATGTPVRSGRRPRSPALHEAGGHRRSGDRKRRRAAERSGGRGASGSVAALPVHPRSGDRRPARKRAMLSRAIENTTGM